MAYRSQRKRKTVQAPEAGVVADMVRQFADRYAFARELVQNAIDAGATRIAVTVQLGADDTAVAAVADDGEGMTRSTIEGPLLTLFSSSKDQARGKIGKYGIGFVSVFAIEPREVVVESWRSGESWVLRLWPDHRYELAQGRAREGSGTVVSVVQSLAAEQFLPHAAQVRAALLRWCRHVGVPLTFFASSPASVGAGPQAAPERLDRPLTVPAVTSVIDGEGDEQIVVAPSAGADLWVEGVASPHEPDSNLERAGEVAPETNPSADAASEPLVARASRRAPLERSASFGGFYNRGLTLFETAEPLRPSLEGIRFKVLDPRLQHTLSRDNVRRDAQFERVVDRVEELVRHQLRAQLERTLAEAAHSAVAEPASARRHAALFAAACSSPTVLAPDELIVPVTNPVDQRSTFSLADLHALGEGCVYVAPAASPVTEALAIAHHPVVLAADRSLLAWIARRTSAASVRQVGHWFLIADEIAASAHSPSDRTLCALLHDVLGRLGAPVARVGLTTTLGMAPRSPVIAIPPGTEARALLRSAHDMATWWSRWARSVDLLLVSDHDWIRRARLKAEHDPLVAAQLLARALVVQQRGPLSSRANGVLLESAARGLSADSASQAEAASQVAIPTGPSRSTPRRKRVRS